MRRRLVDDVAIRRRYGGVLTHLPACLTSPGLNAIVGSATDILDGVLQVLVYNVIWFQQGHRGAGDSATARRCPAVARTTTLGRAGTGGRGLRGPPRTNAPQIDFWVASHGEVSLDLSPQCCG